MICLNCKREITEEMTSPEREHCAECFTYMQDIHNEEQEDVHYITREMAKDAGFPEMEGMIY